MDFTREPIIETIITPKEGCKLVVRSSKTGGQEEHFVDAVQVVSYGNAFFFRSLERPKAFLVPVSDYEILEVREARMVLKNVGVERTIKIAGGRDSSPPRAPREPAPERTAPIEETSRSAPPSGSPDGRMDKKRDRRRQGRRRRGRDERLPEEGTTTTPASEPLGESSDLAVATLGEPAKREGSGLTSILPPPSQLISETIQQYRGNELFKDIFSRPDEGAGAAEAATEEER